MDSIGSSVAGANHLGVGERFVNYAKTVKGKKVIRLATSLLAVAVGTTAAVVFFAVPAAGLPPAVAVVAMAIGVVGLRILWTAAVSAFNVYKAKKNATPSQPSINVAALSPLKLGYQALVKKEVKFEKVNPMLDYELDGLLDSYPEFDGYNSNQTTTRVKTLLRETYDDGTLNGTNGEQYSKTKNETCDQIRFIFKELIVSGSPTAKQKGMAAILGTAFKSCPTERSRALSRVVGQITGEQGDIPVQLFTEWNNRKMALLDKLIFFRHPNCNDSGQAMGAQYPHVWSAYVAQFGRKFGFNQADIATAEEDVKKPTELPTPNPNPQHMAYRGSFEHIYTRELQLELNEFLAFIVQDTNRKLDPHNKQQNPPLINRDAFTEWLAKKGTAGLLELRFGFYCEDKDYSYPVKNGQCSWKPTEQQENCEHPMLTLEEGRTLLRYLEIEIVAE